VGIRDRTVPISIYFPAMFRWVVLTELCVIVDRRSVCMPILSRGYGHSRVQTARVSGSTYIGTSKCLFRLIQ